LWLKGCLYDQTADMKLGKIPETPTATVKVLKSKKQTELSQFDSSVLA